MKRHIIHLVFLLIITCLPIQAQEKYIMHSSQLVLSMGDNNRAQILTRTNSLVSKLELIKREDGKYNIAHVDKSGNKLYLTKNGSWNTYFESSPSVNEAIWSLESEGAFLKIKCAANNQYLGTDATTSPSNVFCDKNGSDNKHLWYLADNTSEYPKSDTLRYVVNPALRRQITEGWGVSLCWWARMCGSWNDDQIDKLVDWLVSPTGLNFNIFRYNIGGGDDPNNTNCDPHHMGKGKGLRAEMEGFQDERGGDYIWSRDAEQRKIMLKIKEKRPDAIFEAFSNSCPWWMTYSGCCSGSTDGGSDNLKPEYYEDFARYLVEVCKHYKDVYDIDFRTLEPFNESMTGFWYANGVQEGCHFDVKSQINFIKVLHPILKESGLNTVISASDETAVYLAVDAIQQYQKAGIMDMVGQWNTHTYTADDNTRSKIGSLARSMGKRQWMSEVGSGGSGLQGNLNMAIKLMDDVRYMVPDAWIDWQYMEENNDQWCMVQGSFSNPSSAKRVKNYYVRQHFSRFIPAGYRFVTSLNRNTLCALSPDEKELVLVLVNNSALKTFHEADLRFCTADASKTKGYVTTETSSLGSFKGFKFDENGILKVTMQPLSIVTLTIPVSDVAYLDVEHLPGKAVIVPQANNALALTAVKTTVSVETNHYNNAQVWDVIDNENGSYSLRNQDSLYLSYNSSNYALTAKTRKSTSQSFIFDMADDYFYRINVRNTKKYFDLQNGSTSSGTLVGSYSYSNGGDITRHWMLVGIDAQEDVEDSILEIDGITSEDTKIQAIYDMQGHRLAEGTTSRGVLILRMKDGSTKKILRR